MIPPEIAAMRQLVGEWLEDKQGDLAPLLAWLQGYDLPVSESGEEPYVWLLRGLPLTYDRLSVTSELASRLACLIEQHRVLARRESRPSQLIYNALMLAAGLAYPSRLWRALCLMYVDQPTGLYLGLDLRHALRSALAENQLDNRLATEWFGMLREDGTATLPGNPFQAYHCILRMPRSPGDVGRLNIEAVADALGVLAHRLQSDDQRWSHFAELISKSTCYGDIPTQPLLSESQHRDWPPWAVLCLISLATITLEAPAPHGLVWEPLFELVRPEATVNVLGAYYGGTVLAVEAAENTWRTLFRLASDALPLLERAPPSYSFLALYEAMAHIVRNEQLLLAV